VEGRNSTNACSLCEAGSGEKSWESRGATASGLANPATQASASLSLKATSMAVSRGLFSGAGHYPLSEVRNPAQQSRERTSESKGYWQT
jgi:hypothetical protein